MELKIHLSTGKNKLGIHEEHSHTENVPESKEAEYDEVKDWKRKLIWAWVLTIPIAILMLASRIFGFILKKKKVMIISILMVAFPVFFMWDFQRLKADCVD